MLRRQRNAARLQGQGIDLMTLLACVLRCTVQVEAGRHAAYFLQGLDTLLGAERGVAQ